MPPRPERFAIDGALLAGPDGDWRWNNLGYWREANGYTEACAALARLHAQAAHLSAGESVLELACGYGAALSLWQQEFAAGSLYGLEYREQCVQAIQNVSVLDQPRVAVGRFDDPLPDLLSEPLRRHPVDAVLCVDAAYHARSLDDFLDSLSPGLKTNGRLVFSTLVRADDPAPFWRRQRNGVLLRLASMPDASVLSAKGLQAVLNQHGFDARLEDISDCVFAGFADWVRRRQQQLRPDQSRSAAWLKIRLTGHWCDALAADQSLRYVMVTGRKRG